MVKEYYEYSVSAETYLKLQNKLITLSCVKLHQAYSKLVNEEPYVFMTFTYYCA